MGLLNYTSSVSADRSAEEIKKCLVQHGAQAILSEYDPQGEYLTALSFKITVNGQTMGFKLPCDWKPVYEIMFGGKRTSWETAKKKEQESRRKDQALRTAWRIVKDWVEAQMALVETKMVTTQQVFLPYAVMRDGRTLAEHVSTDPTFLLGDGK